LKARKDKSLKGIFLSFIVTNIGPAYAGHLPPKTYFNYKLLLGAVVTEIRQLVVDASPPFTVVGERIEQKGRQRP
jgi:hypothetical protein